MSMSNEELLDAYFERTLSDEEEREFQRLMQEDAGFRDEFAFRQELRQALRRQEREELRNLLTGHAGKSRQFSVRRYIPVMVAATIVLLVAIGYLIMKDTVRPDPTALYLAYFEPYENVIHPIERGNPVQDLVSRAFYAYENENYEEAIELFGQLAVQEPDPYIDFYNGIVLLQLDRDQEAVARFQEYLGSDGPLKDRAEWYLALGYLKLGELQKARELLTKLSNDKAYNAEKAGQILDKLD